MKYLSLVLVVLLFSCKGTKLIEEGFKKDQFQMLLHAKVKPQRIQNGFELYGLKYLCSLDTLENRVVFEFDTTLISRKELILKMDKEVGVRAANKTLGCKVNKQNIKD